MKELELFKTLFYIEPGPVTLVTTNYNGRNNIMTITWIMPTSFCATFALCTGPWNYSYNALVENKECVLAIPGESLAETAVRIGDVSGREVDKFKTFNLTPLKASTVNAPLIKECLINIECKVNKYIAGSGIFTLQATKAWINTESEDERPIHAKGDGNFFTEGKNINLRQLMKDKLPF